MKNKNKISCVYMILNNSNLKVYIGSTINYKDSKHHHLYHLNKNKHNNEELQKDYNNGDKISFYLLERCNKENLFKLEYFYGKKYKSGNPDYGYNKHNFPEYLLNKI